MLNRLIACLEIVSCRDFAPHEERQGRSFTCSTFFTTATLAAAFDFLGLFLSHKTVSDCFVSLIPFGSWSSSPLV